MRIFYFTILLFFISDLAAQSPCKCIIPAAASDIVFEHLKDSINPGRASRDFFREHLDKHISAVGLREDYLEGLKIYFGDDGKVCDIVYKRKPTPAIQSHVLEVLELLPELQSKCVVSSCSIVISHEFKPTEDIYKVAVQSPVFNGCDITTNENINSDCSREKLKQYLLQHPLYDQLSFQKGSLVMEFIITKDGRTTLIRPIKGDFMGNEDKVIQIIKDMPLWTPAKNSRGEIVNFVYTLPFPRKK